MVEKSVHSSCQKLSEEAKTNKKIYGMLWGVIKIIITPDRFLVFVTTKIEL